MYSDQMFRTVMRGFDKDEVIAYLKKLEEEHTKAIKEKNDEIRLQNKAITELKLRLERKEAKYDKLEQEVETKYRRYIDEYDKIGALVYESRIRGDRILDDARTEAERLTNESRENSEKMLAEADIEAKRRIDSVQGEVDAKLAEGKSRYLKVQDEMNVIVELINETQRRFMQSYKEVHKIIQEMPVSLREIEEIQQDGFEDVSEAEDEAADDELSIETYDDESLEDTGSFTFHFDGDDDDDEEEDDSDLIEIAAAAKTAAEGSAEDAADSANEKAEEAAEAAGEAVGKKLGEFRLPGEKEDV